MLACEDGRIVVREPPWQALDVFPAEPAGFPAALVRFGQTMTELTRNLAAQ
jgi:hypothetical protein